MEGSNKRQLSPQAGTSGKKAKGPYDPRNEAVAPTKKQPHKPDARPTTQGDSDSESDARDQSYLEGVKNAEINFDFELALDEENIQEAMAMATTEEQRERAKKAAEYIEKVGRISNICSQLLGKQLSNKHMHICLQVKRTRKSLSDPKNKPKVNFWGTPRTRAAAAAAQAAAGGAAFPVAPLVPPVLVPAASPQLGGFGGPRAGGAAAAPAAACRSCRKVKTSEEHLSSVSINSSTSSMWSLALAYFIDAR